MILSLADNSPINSSENQATEATPPTGSNLNGESIDEHF